MSPNQDQCNATLLPCRTLPTARRGSSQQTLSARKQRVGRQVRAGNGPRPIAITLAALGPRAPCARPGVHAQQLHRSHHAAARRINPSGTPGTPIGSTPIGPAGTPVGPGYPGTPLGSGYSGTGFTGAGGAGGAGIGGGGRPGEGNTALRSHSRRNTHSWPLRTHPYSQHTPHQRPTGSLPMHTISACQPRQALLPHLPRHKPNTTPPALP